MFLPFWALFFLLRLYFYGNDVVLSDELASDLHAVTTNVKLHKNAIFALVFVNFLS